ncbi:hypothetical protein C8Q75DRAFT_805593 [Abortiporus biennis]|nr:hypothetical protein C8Q75DRAFT_805593 [Abortiporus biennis]
MTLIGPVKKDCILHLHKEGVKPIGIAAQLELKATTPLQSGRLRVLDDQDLHQAACTITSGFASNITDLKCKLFPKKEAVSKSEGSESKEDLGKGYR